MQTEDPSVETERQVRARVRKRVHSRVGFLWHVFVFLLVNLALAAICLSYTPNSLWFLWPLGAWSAGLAVHAFATFAAPGLTDSMLQAELKRERLRTGPGV